MTVPFQLIFCLLLAAALMAVPETVKAQQELAKESQNPIGNLISVPFENNTSFSEGPEDATVNTLNLKPVYPVSLGKWNLINRGIFPMIYQGERFEGESRNHILRRRHSWPRSQRVSGQTESRC